MSKINDEKLNELRAYISHQNAPDDVIKLKLDLANPNAVKLIWEQLELISKFETCPLFIEAIEYKLSLSNHSIGELLNDALNLRKLAFKKGISVKELVLNLNQEPKKSQDPTKIKKSGLYIVK